MRNLDQYQTAYGVLPFERYMVAYRRKKVLEQIEKYCHNSILEVGCGMEPLFLHFDDYERMTVVEPARMFYENAVKLAEARRGDERMVEVVSGFLEQSVERLKLRSYDMIIVSSLLHEVKAPDLLLRSVGELCAKQTVVHVNVPNAHSLHRLLAMEAGIIPDIFAKSEQQVTMQQSSVFSMDSIKELAEKCGFTVIEQGTYFPKLFTHGQLQAMLDQEILGEQVIEGMYGMEKYLPAYGAELYINIRKDRWISLPSDDDTTK